MSQVEDYRYDAFISYRHVEPDRAWAKWLHRSLETYKVPRRLVENGSPASITRVFRDEEELPASADLSKEIETALQRSQYLIVICSPRVVESRWCNAEVQAFHDLGRSDHILALLVEGEPSDSFVPALREVRRAVVDGDGNESVVVESIEPLAADVRPIEGESYKLRKNHAKLRLLASILGCDFDDLRQRHLERQQQRTRNVVKALAAFAVTLFALTGWALVERHSAIMARDEANRQKEIVLQRQRELLEEKYHTQTERANLALNKQRFPEALNSALKALEVVEELETDSQEVRSLLQQSVDANRLITQLQHHSNTVDIIDFSPDDHLLLTASTSGGEVIVWDTKVWQPVKEFQFPLLDIAYFSRTELGQLVIGQVQEDADNRSSFVLTRVDARSGRVVAESMYRNESVIFDHRYPKRYQSHLVFQHEKWFDEPDKRKFSLCSVETGQRLQEFALPEMPIWFDVVTCRGEEVAVFADSKNVRVFGVKSANQLWTAAAPSEHIECWTLPRDGVLLTRVKRDDQPELIYWDLMNGRELKRHTGNEVDELEFYVDRQRRLHYKLLDKTEKQFLPQQISSAVPMPNGLAYSTRFVTASSQSRSYVCASWSSLTLHHEQLDFRLELPISLPSLQIATLSHNGQILVAADSHDRLHVVDTSLDFELLDGDSIDCFEKLQDGRLLALTADRRLICLDPEGKEPVVDIQDLLPQGMRVRWDVQTESGLLKVENAKEFNPYISFGDRPLNPILLKMHDLRSGRLLLKIDDTISSVISPDGRTVVVMSLQKEHAVYSLDGSLKPHSVFNDRLKSLPYGWEWKYTLDSKNIVAASADGIVEVFDVATGKSLQQFRFHAPFSETSVNEMLLSPRGRWALVDVGGSEQFVIDLKNESTRDISDLGMDSLSGSFYHDETLLVVGHGLEEKLTFFHWPNLIRKFEIRGEADPQGIVFFSNGTILLRDAHSSGILALEADGEVLRRFKGIEAVSDDGTRIVYGDDSEIVIFDLVGQKVLRRLPFGFAHSAAFSKDGKSLYLALGDGGLIKCDLGGHLTDLKQQAQREVKYLLR